MITPTYKFDYNGKELTVTEDLDSIFVFEANTEKHFQLNTMFDKFMFIFSMIITKYPETDFKEYKQYCEENKLFILEFWSKYIVKGTETPIEEEGKKKEKKAKPNP